MSDALSSQGFKLEIGDVGDSPDAMVEIKEVTSFTGLDGQSNEIDVSHTQSTAKEYILGLKDNGGFNVDVNFLPADPGQLEARAANDASTIKKFTATLPDESSFTFSAYVQSAPISGGVDAKIDGSFALRITGAIVWA